MSVRFLLRGVNKLRNVWTRSLNVGSVVKRYRRDRTVRNVIISFRQAFFRPKQTLLLSATAAYKTKDDDEKLPSCDKNITDQELEALVSDFVAVDNLTRALYCKTCHKRLVIEKKQPGIQYCECKDPQTPETSDDGWEPYMEAEDVIIWRKEYKPGQGLYAYKVYGRYRDVTASHFAAVQVDTGYRRVWDSAVAALSVIEQSPTVPDQAILHWEVLWPRLFANRDYVYIRRHKEYDIKIKSTNPSEKTTASPLIVNKKKDTITAPYIFAQAPATPPIVNQGKETTASPTIANQGKETTASPTIVNQGKETTASTPIVNTEKETTVTPPPIVNQETTATAQIVNQEKATTVIPPIVDHKKETTTTALIVNQKRETTTAALIVKQEKETTTTPAIVDPKKQITTSPAIVDPKTEITTTPAIVESKKQITNSPAVVDPKKQIADSPATVDPKREITTTPAIVDPKKEITSTPPIVDPKKEITSTPLTVDPNKETSATPTIANQGKETTATPSISAQEKVTTTTPPIVEQERPSVHSNAKRKAIESYSREEEKLPKDNKVYIIISKSCQHPKVPESRNAIRVTEYWSHMVVRTIDGTAKPGMEFVLTYYDAPSPGGLPSGVTAWATGRAAPVYLTKMRHAAKHYLAYKKEHEPEVPEVSREVKKVSYDETNKTRVNELDMESSKQGPDIENELSTKDKSSQTDENTLVLVNVNAIQEAVKLTVEKAVGTDELRESNQDASKSDEPEDSENADDETNTRWWRYLHPFYYFV